jgi:hypothetical protein
MIRASFVVVICALAISASTSVAQTSDPPRFEVGGQFSLLNFDVFDNFGYRRRNEFGGGGRVAININRYIAAEAQVDHFPQNDSVLIGTIDVPLWGSKTLAVFGVRAGVRNNRFGVFGKARPGFIYFSDVPGFACIIGSGPCPQPRKTVFAFDVGGVVEYYPSRRTVLRVDLGDTVIRQDQRFFSTSHSFQISIGAAVRF